MATHLAAYTATVETDVETELSAVKDDVLTRTAAERFMVPADLNNVYWKAALGVNLEKARIYTPTLEMRRTVPYVVPHVRGAIKFGPDKFRVDICEPPISLTATEELSFYGTSGAAERIYGLVSLAPDTLPPAPAGEVRVVRCTGNTTLVPNEWTSVKITPDVALEPGTYVLVGMLPISANAIAARAIITGQVWRPGVPAIAGDEATALGCNRNFLKAVQNYAMGTFTHINIPEVQFLSSAADTSEVVYLYLVKTG